MSKTGEQQPADMEVDSSAAVEEKQAAKFSINGELYPPSTSSGDLAPRSVS